MEERVAAFFKQGFNDDPFLIQMTFGCCENTARNWLAGRCLIEFWRFVVGMEHAPPHVQDAAAATLGLAWVNPDPPQRRAAKPSRAAAPATVPAPIDQARSNLRRAG